MQIITNPILKGFNPDPSITRVDHDYYIATSTFEWFPGVQIHHSRDLVHWKLITRPLERLSQLDLRGDDDSGGVWAPNLSWHDGLFYLIYTDVKQWRGPYKVLYNYLVTAPDIMGPWSEPVFLNSSGFDPSLFHDDDGRKWILNQLWDHRQTPRTKCFAGIIIQEYAQKQQKLTGPVHNIFKGTELTMTEGPNLYKHNGLYYLITAEGGTSYGHTVTLSRAASVEGPYEVSPINPLLTSTTDSDLVLQKAGHASLIDTPQGDWYLVHLCGRPIGKKRNCILGRETSIQKCEWTDEGWLQLTKNHPSPSLTVIAPEVPEFKYESQTARDDFDTPELDLNFQTLRVPADDSWLSLTEHPGFLRLYGREPLTSRHDQSLVARRVQSFRCQASTCLEFKPDSFQQMAGLTAFYDAATHYYLFISYDETQKKYLSIMACDHEKLEWPLDRVVNIEGCEKIYLRAKIDYEILQFSYSKNGDQWSLIGPELDATKLSDEYANGFTGSFFGICAQDLSGKRKIADFDFFEYVEFI